MKTKSLVLFLTLALVSWGQTVNPSAPTDKPGQPAATQCACCDKMAAGASSDHTARCHSNKSKGGETTACCSKEGKSCCSDKAQCGKPDTANATTASCCSAKGQCGAKGKSCCGEHMQSATMACCGNQCGPHASSPTELKN